MKEEESDLEMKNQNKRELNERENSVWKIKRSSIAVTEICNGYEEEEKNDSPIRKGKTSIWHVLDLLGIRIYLGHLCTKIEER